MNIEPHIPGESISLNWNILKNCITSAAEEVVGRGWRKQLEWFLEAADTLRPLLDATHAALNKFLQADSTANRKAFRKHQRVVNSAVNEAKKEWVKRVKSDAESQEGWMIILVMH